VATTNNTARTILSIVLFIFIFSLLGFWAAVYGQTLHGKEDSGFGTGRSGIRGRMAFSGNSGSLEREFDLSMML
jgi:hypothetical protein